MHVKPPPRLNRNPYRYVQRFGRGLSLRWSDASLFRRLLSSYLIIILLTAVTVVSVFPAFTNYYRGAGKNTRLKVAAARSSGVGGAVDLEYMMDSFEDCRGRHGWWTVGVVQKPRAVRRLAGADRGPFARELAAGGLLSIGRRRSLSAGIITVAVPIRKSDGVDGGFAPHIHAEHIKDHAGGQALVLPDVDGQCSVHRGKFFMCRIARPAGVCHLPGDVGAISMSGCKSRGRGRAAGQGLQPFG